MVTRSGGAAPTRPTRGGPAAASSSGLSPWLAPNPAKRWTELFFLAYSPVWITWLLLVLVPFKLYEASCRGCGGPQRCSP